MLTMPLDNPVLLPLALISGLGLLVLAAEFTFRRAEPVSYWISVAGLAASGAALFPGAGRWTGLPSIPGFGGFFTEVFVTAALLTIILSRRYIAVHSPAQGEYYLLVLFAVAGMIMMAAATDLVMVFLGLELMSVCLYVLAGYFRWRPSSNEASLKYFLLGAFITGFILYGIALVYGSTGTLSLAALIDRIETPGQGPLFWTGAVLILAGFAFKVGAFPFHMWIPDVYQGAPTPVTAFMATGAKAAAFSVLLSLFASPGSEVRSGMIRDIFSFLAAGSMIVGNVLAISQQNVKRMLAYSSIAHAGYMLAGLASGSETGAEGVVFYLVSYLIMNIGALGIVSLIEAKDETRLLYDDYAGLAGRSPFLAALMAMFLFSLAGLPPFGGFFGKYFVFVAAVGAGLTWLAILGVLASLVGVYYYLRLVMVMYFQEGETAASTTVPLFSAVALSAAAIVNLHLGILPSTVISLIQGLR